MKTTWFWILIALLLASCSTTPANETTEDSVANNPTVIAPDDTCVTSLEQDENSEVPEADFTVRAGEFTAYTLLQGSYEVCFGGSLWAEVLGAEQYEGIPYSLRFSKEDGTEVTIAFSNVPDGVNVSWPVFDYSPGVIGVTFAQATIITEEGEAIYHSNVLEGLQGQVVFTRSEDTFSGEFDFTIAFAEGPRGVPSEARFTGT
ncbi:MAG: hypothetical protein KC496_15565, partial [Anaerolineae bacterium]|nr:hypothetical protein [Anaerolineae bacterium]